LRDLSRYESSPEANPTRFIAQLHWGTLPVLIFKFHNRATTTFSLYMQEPDQPECDHQEDAQTYYGDDRVEQRSTDQAATQAETLEE